MSLETASDGFVEDSLTRLEGAGIRESDLHGLWTELKTESAPPALTRFRRLEAQLGSDPDEAEEAAIRLRLDAAPRLGEEALGERAAAATLDENALSNMMTAGDFENIARRNGFEATPHDAITLGDNTNLLQPGQVEAWRWGEQAARAIRARERLDGEPVSETTLAGCAGSVSRAISSQGWHACKISFALDCDDGTRVSLRSRRQTGKRFDLARLIGDRLLQTQSSAPAEPLCPATRASSYRQKAQRAFAAEFLSPCACVAELLGGDDAEEKQNEVADHCDVSPMTIQTPLVNQRRMSPDDAPNSVGHARFASAV